MTEFITIKDQFGNDRLVPTVQSVYTAYQEGTIEADYCMSLLHDKGIVNDTELRNFNMGTVNVGDAEHNVEGYIDNSSKIDLEKEINGINK